MTQIADFLKEAGVFFLATADGDQPKVRPLGAFQEIDGTVYFGVGDFKDVYKQMKANPKAEIVACQGPVWMRYTGTVVFDSAEIADKFLAAMPDLAKMYADNNWTMAAFHLENATCVRINLMGPGEDMM